MPRKKVQPDSKSPSSKKKTQEGVPASRKMEILGVLIIFIAVLIGISVLSYGAGDDTLLRKITLSKLFESDSGAHLRIKNWLGPIGAYISRALVYYGFGYASIVIPILLGVYGWQVFRDRTWQNISWNSLFTLSGMVLFASFAGWFKLVYKFKTISWSGYVGDGIASGLSALGSYVGSFLFLCLALIVMILLSVDRDIQVTIDRIKEWFQERNDTLKEKQALRAEKKKAREEEKLAAKKVEIAQQEDFLDSEDEIFDTPRKIATPQPTTVDATSKPKSSPSVEKSPPVKEEEDLLGKRAVLESAPTSAEPTPPDVNVYVGEEEAEAKASDLKKMQKEGASDTLPVIRYSFPTISLLDSPPNEGKEVDMEEIEEKKAIILDKLNRHGIEITSIDAIVGPTVTLYELTPAPDVKISKIESYANDLKMAMAAHGLRIIAPIPGKAAVGIEVPNNKRETVYIKQVLNTRKFVDSKMDLPVAFGKTIENEIFTIDLTKMPHLLVAGATGSGKSVGINTIITCLLYKCHPDNLKFVLVDPKKIELALYKSLERHFLATLPDMDEPIITDTSKVLEVLQSVCKEMDNRYDLLKDAMVRDLKAYNEKFKNGELDPEKGHRHLPYIVVIIDELADLMMTAGKNIEEPIARIAQLARAVGIHSVIATQRPSVNVITGTIKANFPARIAYAVASKIDSRTILDTMGGEQLVGRGDMLFSHGGPIIRVQNAFVSTEEVERITNFIGDQEGYNEPYYLPVIESEEDQATTTYDKSDRDDLFEDAAKVVVMHQQGSVSLLQRKLRLGYNRAGRIIDQLYSAGIVGPYQGSTAREVLVETDEELDDILRNLD